MGVDVTEAATLAAWFDPKIVVPAIGVVLASVIVPILLHILKEKRESEKTKSWKFGQKCILNISESSKRQPRALASIMNNSQK